MPLTVLSYNIHEGGEGHLTEIAALIRAQQPDAVALLEANSRMSAERLADDLGMQFVFGEANSAAHIAWLSRLPMRHSENHRHPALAKTLLEIEVAWDGASVRLFATHLGSRWDVSQPVTEVRVILEVLRQHGDRLHLLLGDFNALTVDDPVGTPPHGVAKRGDAGDDAPRPALRPLRDAGYIDCYRALHPHTPGFTYPALHPWLRLDYIFASPELARHLDSCGIDASDDARHASDHLPICATFRHMN